MDVPALKITPQMKNALDTGFAAAFGGAPDRYFSAPGRTEIGELKTVAAHFGKDVLTEIDEADFFAAIPALREACGDRAVLRAIHFYQENARVPKQVAALEQGDFAAFLELIKESGRSSYMYLQNVVPAGCKARQDVALTLAMCEHFLRGRGACRVLSIRPQGGVEMEVSP